MYALPFHPRGRGVVDASDQERPVTSPFRWNSRALHSVFHVKQDPAHSITPVAGPTGPGQYAVAPRERGSVCSWRVEASSLMFALPQVCPGDSHTETLSLTYAVSLRESLHTGLAESRHRTSCTRRWAVSSPLSSGTTSPRSSNSVPLSGSVFTCRRRTSPAPGHGGGRKPTPE